MAKLPAITPPDPTLEAVDRAIEARAAEELPRPYLGMSQIGEPCERRLWYSFRWAVSNPLPAAALYRIEDGHRTEELIASRLRMAPGVKLYTVDPSTGQQIACTDHGGHFRGHLDGVVLGLAQAPKTWHVWECKATGEDKQAKLAKLKAERGEKAALAEWDPVYWAQAQVYMHYHGMSRHYLTCASPGGRTVVSVRTDADRDAAERLRTKALRVITSSEPLPRLSEDPAWYQCKFCPTSAVCRGQKLPAVSCRTCAHATPEIASGPTGSAAGAARWSCARWNEDIPLDAQRTGCPEHRYIPALITFAEQTDADAAANWIEYRMPDGRAFVNCDPSALGPRAYTSAELLAIDPAMIGEAGLDNLREAFGARVVAPSEPAPMPESDGCYYRWSVDPSTGKPRLARMVKGGGRAGGDAFMCWIDAGHPDFQRCSAESFARAEKTSAKEAA